jgi:hypothetical protein
MIPDGVFTVPRVGNDLLSLITYLLEVFAETWASLSLVAQSSQQTSTVLPPILTLMEFESSLQSQAAQVLSRMTFLQYRCFRVSPVGHL